METTCSGKPQPGTAPDGATGHVGRKLGAAEGNQVRAELIKWEDTQGQHKAEESVLGVRDGDSWEGLSLSAE